MRRLSCGFVLACALIAAMVTPAHADEAVTRTNIAQDHTASGATCEDYSIPVTLKPGRTERYPIFGRLCSKTGFAANRPVQLLLHGGTYNHTYWDWPYQPENYNYVKYATDAGFVTLAIDRLGYGYSAKPALDVEIDFESNAWVAHQVIQYLRSGAFGNSYRKVALVGHSLGAATAMTEAGRYQDVDATIISGGTHSLNYVGIFGPASFYPATLDPKFFGKLPITSTSLTTLPGSRCRTFYDESEVDPGVCAEDERLKDVFTGGEVTQFPIAFTRPSPSDQIVSPVLVALGKTDKFMCSSPTILAPDCSAPGSQAYNEYKYYPSAKSYELYIQPRSGHMNNLQFGARVWFDKANSWLLSQL